MVSRRSLPGCLTTGRGRAKATTFGSCPCLAIINLSPFIQGKGNDAWAVFSPDGKWVAYSSDESGQTGIYVVPFPGPGGKWQVSKAGGAQAFWPRGKELFYVSIDFQMIGVEFEVQGNNFLVGKSRRLFEGQSVSSSLGQNPDGSASVDVNEDGTRWLVALPVDERNASPLGALTHELDGRGEEVSLVGPE